MTSRRPPRTSHGPTLPTSFEDGRYEVNSLLGEGAMKRVYLVNDTLLDREVAFALIKYEGLNDADRKRILQEAQTMARLGDHPNIMPIYELGDEDGQPYMVLPLMAGGTVEELLGREKAGLSLDSVLEVARDVCQGLDFAHSKGVIHRDLKPSNVWLTSAAVAKIGDFGIAFSAAYTRMTDSGHVLGTVHYMSPEQAMGGEIDERSDLYSLGSMLYELVVGTPPFQGSHPVAIISQHINSQPAAPSEYRAECPPTMDALILSMLEKDPSDRPSSAGVVLGDLEKIAKAAGEADLRPAREGMARTVLRVLHVEDSPDDAMLVLRELSKGDYEVSAERVDTPAAMREALDKDTWDIVIADYSMPHFSAPAALKLLQNSGLDLPFIIASATVTEEMAVAAMKAGAHDFVMKDNLARLNPAVDREMREAEGRRARRKAEHEERRLHEELEKRNLELERLVTRLKVPDDRLQQQLSRHLDSLKRLVKDAGEIVENAQDPRSTGGPAEE